MASADTPISILHDEHLITLLHLDRIEAAVDAMQQGGDGFAQAVADLQAGAAFVAAELPQHFAKEEEALFPPIDERTGGGGFTAAMRVQHEELAEWREKFEAVVARLDPNAPATAEVADELRKAGYSLAGGLREHIDKEEMILVQLVEELLPESEQFSIAQQFADVKARFV